QSSLSTFINCPKDYFFDKVVTSPDRDYFKKGDLFHDFAEFYVNYPEIVAEANYRELLDIIVAEMRPYIDDVDVKKLETEFEIGFNLITEFLDNQPPSEEDYHGYESSSSDNIFADYFDQPITSSITEVWFENPDLGAKGKVDLIHSPDRLVDYKSSNSKSASKHVSQSDIDDIADEPNFQALQYLAHHRQEQPNQQLEFVFFYFLDLVEEAITGEPDIGDAITRIHYYPVSFEEYVSRREAFDAIREGVVEGNDRRKTLERMGYDAYRSFFNQHGFPDITDTDALLDSEFATMFTEYAKEEVGDYKYVENGTDQTLKQLQYMRGENYFKEDVDRFEEFLQEQINRINEYRRSQFPVEDPNFDDVNHRDLIRTND
ncbi:MAG: PD-(D/E)XK nuclease family protein, partial [Halobacteriaceae archaeon]